MIRRQQSSWWSRWRRASVAGATLVASVASTARGAKAADASEGVRACPPVGANGTYGGHAIPDLLAKERLPKPGDDLDAYARGLTERHPSHVQAFDEAWAKCRPVSKATPMIALRRSFVEALVSRGGWSRDDAAEGALRMEQAVRRTQRVLTPSAAFSGDLDAFVAWRAQEARGAATTLGAPWPMRVDAAARTVVSGVSAAERQRDLELVAYAMALAHTGQLERVPDDAIDDLLAIARSGDEAAVPVRAALTWLAAADPTLSAPVLRAIRGVHAARRALAWRQLVREHDGLLSAVPADVRGSAVRVQQAAHALEADEGDVLLAFASGHLGLDRELLTVVERARSGEQARRVDVPISFHPGVDAATREIVRRRAREAFLLLPFEALRSAAGGDREAPFTVQVLAAPSFKRHDDAGDDDAPDEEYVGWHLSKDNVMRLNAAAFAQPDPLLDPTLLVLHEAHHLLDDLAHDDPPQLATWAGGRAGAALSSHWEAMRALPVVASPDDEVIPPGVSVAPAVVAASDVAQAGRRGGVRSYVFESETEWWAETMASASWPPTRRHLRAVDPVGLAVADHYRALLRTAPSSEAFAAAAILLDAATLADQSADRLLTADAPPLDEAVAALELHAAAFEGWTAFRGDAVLAARRRSQAAQTAVAADNLVDAIGVAIERTRDPDVRRRAEKNGVRVDALAADQARVAAAAAALARFSGTFR
jgi:hypothetical protein